MKLPKTAKKYCPKCKKHTEQKIIQGKRRTPGSVHTQSHGAQIRAKARGKWRGQGNKGRFSRPPVGSRKMSGKKLTKKTDLRYECSVCKKQSIIGSGFRAKKVQFNQ